MNIENITCTKINILIIFLAVRVFSPMAAFAAGLSIPEKAVPGAMLVVEVNLQAEESKNVTLKFDPSVVQYAGPLVPTTDVQNPSEGIVEITKSASSAQEYSLKFFDLGKASETSFKLFFGEKLTESKKVVFTVEENRKSYNLHLLVAGLVLIVLGWFFLRVQKKTPALMSTRSLFMNYEELQKMRDQYNLPSSPSEDAPQSIRVKAEPSGEKQIPSESLQDSSHSIPVKTEESPSPSVFDTKPSISESSAKEKFPETKTPEITQEPKIDTKAEVKLGKTLPEVPEKTANLQQTTQRKFNEDPSDAKTVARSLASRENAPKPTKIFLALVDDQGNRFEGSGDEVTLGRNKVNVIVFTASEISRHHAVVKVKGDGFVVNSLASGNITEVNGKEVKGDVPIKAGDRLSLGGTAFKVDKLELR